MKLIRVRERDRPSNTFDAVVYTYGKSEEIPGGYVAYPPGSGHVLDPGIWPGRNPAAYFASRKALEESGLEVIEEIE